MTRPTQADATWALSRVTGLPVVDVAVEGRSVVMAFEPDLGEHERRMDCQVEAVTSTGDLHGLWLLPSGIPVPVDQIPPVKLRRLRAANGFVQEGPRGFERTYSPPGVVRAVGFIGAEAKRVIANAARFTPILQRFALVSSSASISRNNEVTASETGIGIIECASETSRVVLPAPPPVLGRPAVYRWWVAELAYEQWLQESIQPVS